ncbi:MAG: ISNCY family transposase [Phycisphaerales bacterium]|nr:ISNCY family transposase [Phycisphaerales bacterium]
MSAKERVRLDVMRRVERGELTMATAAELMRVSPRQAKRIRKRFKTHKDAGLVHQLRGRAGNRRLPEELRQRIVKRHQERYHDFGPTFACEKLAEDGFAVGPDTLVNLLKERGLWECRRRRKRHRSRRERRSSFGMMVQMDGSHHDWFEGRCAKCVLMVMIDDATNRTYARFYRAETTDAAFDVFGRWSKHNGVPRSVYVDRHSIYRDEDHPDRPTQFGRAMKELNVALILAHSPQAKGRVERRNAVFQDRLVKELRLRNISDMAQANAFLEQNFLADLNRRFAVVPRLQTDLHRVLPVDFVLEEILCVQEVRVVGRDWCVRWKNKFLQIPAEHASLDLVGKNVLVKQLSGGQLLVSHQNQPLSFRELPVRPTPERTRMIHVNRMPWKPAANHKWRNDPVGRAASPRRGGPTPAPVGATAMPPPLPTPTSDRHDAHPLMSG